MESKSHTAAHAGMACAKQYVDNGFFGNFSGIETARPDWNDPQGGEEIPTRRDYADAGIDAASADGEEFKRAFIGYLDDRWKRERVDGR